MTFLWTNLPSEDGESEYELERDSPDDVAPVDVAGVRGDEEAEHKEGDDADAGGEALGLGRDSVDRNLTNNINKSGCQFNRLCVNRIS